MDIRERFAKMRQEAEDFEAAFRPVLETHKAFRCTKYEANPYTKAPHLRAVTVTPSCLSGVVWQLTYFTDGEPTGHLDINSFEEVARLIRPMLKGGYVGDERFGLAWSGT